MALLLGCSASDREAPDPATLEIAKPASNSGDGQVGVAGVRLPDSLRVIVTRDEAPVEGVTVIWFTTEGSVNPATVRTGPDGMAATTWTPLQLFAEQFAVARLDDGNVPAVGFTAIATPDPDAPSTILVLSEGNRFEPADFNVSVGGTVNWFWPPGSIGHNIVPDNGESPPQSGAPADWPKWHVFQFTTPGVYRYHCATHGSAGGVGMSGVITVEQASWHVLLGPLPAGATPRASPVASSALHATSDVAAIAGWESLVLELSAGSAGLRTLQVLLDAEGRLLSASDHVLFRSEPAGQSATVQTRQESIGGALRTRRGLPRDLLAHYRPGARGRGGATVGSEPTGTVAGRGRGPPAARAGASRPAPYR